MTAPKVTVYITNHNYDLYLRQAIESVLHQTYQDWELLIIDDGSTDGSRRIIKEYEGLPNVRVVFQERCGLPVSCNIALRLARGTYIMRLDADDYLDENALVVLVNILDTQPWVGLVYPDYYRIDEHGEILSIERRNKIGKEILLWDIPAHGACTMIRTQCLVELGGYSEDLACHDGYDLWVRFIERFGVNNVNVPLFYYRQHSRSVSADKARILAARRAIKRQHVERRRGHQRLNVVGIIPARGRANEPIAYALRSIAGRPLIDYTIDAAIQSEALKALVVVSEDREVLEYVHGKPGVMAVERPVDLARPNTPIIPTIQHVLKRVGPEPPLQAFLLLYVNTPMRQAIHIRNAVDAMLTFDVDSVISVYEDLTTHYHHVGNGLKPLFRRGQLRLEKEALWVENGAIYLAKTAHLTDDDYYGERIGHIVMLRRESLQIDAEEDAILVEHLLNLQRSGEILTHG